MIITTTSGQRFEPDNHRATEGSGPMHHKDAGHGKNQHRSAKIKSHRPHPSPIMPRKTTVIQTSNPQQAAAPANTQGIKSP
ncbi:MAG: hypothetical protein ACR2P3_07360 [Geminicoccaceae bacterium]